MLRVSGLVLWRPKHQEGCMAFIATLVFGLAIGMLPVSSWAQEFPAQRVTIVVPFGAGSVTDITARIIAEELSRRWAESVIVENRPGLAGTAAVSKATPDGYTLMLTSNGHTVAGFVNKNLPFDPVKDFAGITRVSSAPFGLIVSPELPAKSVSELVALARAKPGSLNFTSPGLASTSFIAGALFRKQQALDIVHVPFKSAPEAVTAVLRGDAQIFIGPMNLWKETAEAGKVRVLAVPTAQRLSELPNVPTFREAGFDFVYDSWFGLMTQSAVPRQIIYKINREVVSILQTPEVTSKFVAQFLVPRSDSPEEFDAVIRKETEQLAELFKDLGPK
jgi:tripartite-type tricarboxylate transporter receptor subunit TctC